MTTTFRKWGLPLVMAASVFSISCDKDDDDAPAGKTITQTVIDNPDFSLLKAAVVRAGLDDDLASAGPFTVFAPNNAAFNAAGFANEAAINAAPVATLQSILQYHVLSGKVDAASVPAGPNAEVATLGGGKIFATRNANGVFINGVKVVTADVAATNGVIHVIGKVLMPPTGNIVQTAQANPNLTFLVAAVLRASTGGTDVAGVLSGAGPLTVFAPTNAAFQAAGFATIDAINAADPATLTSILTYHVIGARVFSSDLTEGAQPTTVNGGKVTITLSGGAKVKGNSNTAASNISITDIVTTNGVVHVIDGVLLP